MDPLTGLTGPAAVRGQRWGRSLYHRRPGQPWPAYDASARVRAITLKLVRDLVSSGDPGMLDALARIAADAAEREYREPTPRCNSDVID